MEHDDLAFAVTHPKWIFSSVPLLNTLHYWILFSPIPLIRSNMRNKVHQIPF